MDFNYLNWILFRNYEKTQRSTVLNIWENTSRLILQNSDTRTVQRHLFCSPTLKEKAHFFFPQQRFADYWRFLTTCKKFKTHSLQTKSRSNPFGFHKSTLWFCCNTGETVTLSSPYKGHDALYCGGKLLQENFMFYLFAKAVYYCHLDWIEKRGGKGFHWPWQTSVSLSYCPSYLSHFSEVWYQTSLKKTKPAEHRSVWSPLRGSCFLTVRLQPPFSRCCWGRKGWR